MPTLGGNRWIREASGTSTGNPAFLWPPGPFLEGSAYESLWPVPPTPALCGGRRTRGKMLCPPLKWFREVWVRKGALATTLKPWVRGVGFSRLGRARVPHQALRLCPASSWGCVEVGGLLGRPTVLCGTMCGHAACWEAHGWHVLCHSKQLGPPTQASISEPSRP